MTQVEDWLLRHEMLERTRHEEYLVVDVSDLMEPRWFELPRSVEARTYLGDIVAELFAEQDEILVYVDGWGETPEYDWDLNLFARFRQALGCIASKM